MNLLEKVRQIKTIGDQHEVYANADIRLKSFRPESVFPIARYVLKDSLERLRETAKRVDIFHLTDTIVVDGQTYAPPVVEYDNGCDCVVDGIHRFYLARQMGEKVNAIYIKNASRHVLAFPVMWGDVKEVESQPTNPRECRILRVTDEPTELRKYYRDFSSLGSMGRRPRSGQNG